MNDTQSYNLTLTNKTLSIGSKVYQIRNIARVSTYTVKPTSSWSYKRIAVLGILGLLLLLTIGDAPILGLVGLVMFAAAGYGVWDHLRQTDSYALRLESGASVDALIASDNRSRIQEIVGRIVEAMNNDDVPISQTWNITAEELRMGATVNQNGLLNQAVTH